MLRLGYSFCPNDTWIFYALTHGRIPWAEPVQQVLEDVETLNRWAGEGRLELTKVSYHALFHVLPNYAGLRSGGALGRGVGPILVAKPGSRLSRVATPGPWTTAHLLLQLARPDLSPLLSLRYDQLIPSLLQGDIDGAVLIHESRFAYQDYGLEGVLDLGQWWESESGLPLPLGVILARRDLGEARIQGLDQAIKASLEWSRQNPQASAEYIRQHAIELSPEIIERHIHTYVNDFSLEVGEEGEEAVLRLWEWARRRSLVPDHRLPLFHSSSLQQN